jgi:catechol 2,3-dioxygenase-like lactoylglutathione lyase family enzyme
MLGSAHVNVLIGTTRPDASKAFYKDTLGLKFIVDDTFALVFDANGTPLRVSRVPLVVPSTYAVLGFRVPDIASAVDGLSAKGVKFERFGFLQQDTRGVWAAPDGAQVAWFRDPDMNMLSLVQHA